MGKQFEKINNERRQAYEQLKNRLTSEIINQYYIIEDHSYYNCLEHFNIKGWTFDKLLREYNIKKDRHISGKRSVKTRIEQVGGRDLYNKKQLEVSRKTKIEKYGSLEEYNNYISSKCSVTWNNKSPEEKARISELNMSHGAGWNHKTISKTLLEKYGIDNAYKLASHYQTNSKVNQDFADMLEQNNIQYLREQLLEHFRYDFKIGNKILVEIDPWPFHNITWCPIKDAKLIDKNYHKEKTKLATDNDLRCIHIFDWDDKNKIVNLLKSRETIYGRECNIKELDRDSAKDFLNTYHLQGYARDSIRLGLFYKDELVSVMTFGKPRYNKKYEYELIRLCSIRNIIGGEEKLFSYFINTYIPQSIISYCDLSKFTGKTYDKLNFKRLRVSDPAKHWYNPKTQQHITDNLLRQQGFDRLFKTNFGKGTDNNELMRNAGFVEIYDCGQATYIWNNSNK